MSRLLQLFVRRYLAPEGDGGGGGGGGGGDGGKGGRTDPEPEVFSKEYVKELRAEAKGYRLKAAETETQKKASDDAAAKATKDAEDKVKAANTAADQRVIRAELKAEALKAGMVDLDGLKLADLSKVKLSAETGEVEGATELMAQLKKDKPYLFGAASSNTSNTGEKPKPKDGEKVDVTKLTPEEYKAARAAAVKR